MIDYSVYMMTPTFSRDETPKAYAKNQVSEIWTLEKFAKHIADHNGVYSRGTVKGVISDIQLGELGTFGISISSEGAESIDKFTAKNIKAVNILFDPGKDFENMIDRADFNPVASRAAQIATLKAEKAGESTVDLAAAKGGSTTTPGTGGSGTGTGNEDTGSDGSFG